MESTRPKATSYRLGDADIKLIVALSAHLSETTGVSHSQADVVRLAVRQLAKRERLGSVKKDRDER